jgi:hypothetical protein
MALDQVGEGFVIPSVEEAFEEMTIGKRRLFRDESAKVAEKQVLFEHGQAPW